MKVIINELKEENYEEWSKLWEKYLDFYKTKLTKEIYENTFKRLIDKNENDTLCFLAFSENKAIALVHLIFHFHNWKIEKALYLQDLYVLSNFRKKGVGRKMIEYVYELADKKNLSYVYWLTQDFNLEARSLYNKVGKVTPFIKYNRF